MKSNVYYRFFKKLLDYRINSLFNVEVRSLDLYDESKTYYIVANHTSWLDPFLILSVLPQTSPPAIVIEKSSAFTKGIINKIAKVSKLSYIEVDRADSMSRMSSLRNIMRTLKEGQSVLLFPEGRINPDSNRMYPLYKGGFLAATSNQVEILPIKIKGAEKLYKGRNIVIEIGDSIQTSKKDNLDELATKVFYKLRDEMITDDVHNDDTICRKDFSMKYLTTLAPPPVNLGDPIADGKDIKKTFSEVNRVANNI